jgi:ATP-dependent Clp protease ATP-binding subunit ClpC
MNGYNFTERVRKSLQLARQEASALRHDYVGTEHILLGLVAEGGGVAESAITNLGIKLSDVRTAVLQTVKPGQADGANDTSPGLLSAIAETIGVRRSDPDLPYTSRAKKALELSMMEARELNHAYVGTEHLLLGLLREERGIAAQVLSNLGMTTTGVRAEVLRLLGGAPPSAAPSETERAARTEREAAITLVVEHPDGRIEAKKFTRSGDAVSFLKGLEY